MFKKLSMTKIEDAALSPLSINKVCHVDCTNQENVLSVFQEGWTPSFCCDLYVSCNVVETNNIFK